MGASLRLSNVTASCIILPSLCSLNAPFSQVLLGVEVTFQRPNSPQAILKEAAFKEHREEKKMHLAKIAHERRDAPASNQQAAHKKIIASQNHAASTFHRHDIAEGTFLATYELRRILCSECAARPMAHLVDG